MELSVAQVAQVAQVVLAVSSNYYGHLSSLRGFHFYHSKLVFLHPQDSFSKEHQLFCFRLDSEEILPLVV